MCPRHRCGGCCARRRRRMHEEKAMSEDTEKKQMEEEELWLQWEIATDQIQEMIHQNAVDHGFWPEEGRNDGECIALMHSELSEALEALRDGNPLSDKAEGYTMVEEELADVIVRILDYAQGNSLDVSGALAEKMRFNATRPPKHGREF